jgi:Sulfatase
MAPPIKSADHDTEFTPSPRPPCSQCCHAIQRDYVEQKRQPHGPKVLKTDECFHQSKATLKLTMKTTLTLALILANVASALAEAAVTKAATTLPIFIYADNWGWGDLASHGHPHLKTPNLDRLAKEGSDFHQFTVCNPVCSPSRVAIVTGQYPARQRIHYAIGAHAVNASYDMPDWLDPKVTLLPRLLKEAGYTTGHFGKWHLGSAPHQAAPLPADYGYDADATWTGSGRDAKDTSSYRDKKATPLTRWARATTPPPQSNIRSTSSAMPKTGLSTSTFGFSKRITSPPPLTRTRKPTLKPPSRSALITPSSPVPIASLALCSIRWTNSESLRTHLSFSPATTAPKSQNRMWAISSTTVSAAQAACAGANAAGTWAA